MVYKTVKTLCKLFLFLFVFYKVSQFCDSKTSGFSLLKIHSNLPYSPNWAVEGPAPDRELFDQRFYFLGCGGQCYAFVSEDGKVVLKFFKHHLRRLPLWLRVLPLPQKWEGKRTLQKEKRRQKLVRDFQSYKIAFEELKEETGLLYIHLNKTEDLALTARVVDRLGIEHQVSLDQVEFILQKKGVLAYPYLDSLIEKGEIEEAKKALVSLCKLILTRCERGIFDEDAKIHRNFGFCDNEAFLIDVGRLKKDETRKQKQVQQEDLFTITKRLYAHLETKAPELAHYLKELCEN